MEFLLTFLRRHFAGLAVVTSRNVGCFFKLRILTSGKLLKGPRSGPTKDNKLPEVQWNEISLQPDWPIEQ